MLRNSEIEAEHENQVSRCDRHDDWIYSLVPPNIRATEDRKECREEWKANKAANQSSGVTEKAYVAQCQSGAAVPPPAAAPAARPIAAAPSTSGGGKTTKACREEWRTNKATNQANGVTEKAYVEKCRTGAVSAPPIAAPPTERSSAPPAATTTPLSTKKAGAKTRKACQEEWRANKAANQANGVTEKSYVEQCRTGAATAQPTAAPTEAPPGARSRAPAPPAATPTAAAPPAAPAPAPTATQRPAPSAPGATSGANEFATEAQAKSHCPSDTVVWANLRSHIYHFAGTRFYGSTEAGTYMCERDATAAGVRAAKNETHP